MRSYLASMRVRYGVCLILLLLGGIAVQAYSTRLVRCQRACASLASVAGMQELRALEMTHHARDVLHALRAGDQQLLDRQLSATGRLGADLESGQDTLMGASRASRVLGTPLHGIEEVAASQANSILEQHRALIEAARAGDAEAAAAMMPALDDASEAYRGTMRSVSSAHAQRSAEELARIDLLAWAIVGAIGLFALTMSLIIFEPTIRANLAAWRDLEQEARRAAASEREAQRLSLVVERTTNAVIITDLDERIEWVNDGFTRITGYTLEEVRGRKPGHVLQCEQTDPGTVERLREAIARREPFQGEILNRGKDGREYWLALDIQPLHEGGVLTGFMAVESDITELRDSRDAAEAASRAKSEFLANMSHEIRTPMTAILGYTELLGEDEDFAREPERAAEAIQTVRANAEHLLAIINDILDMSKVEAGRMSVERARTSPALVAEEAAALMRGGAVEKGIDLRVRYETPIPASIESDPTRLRQILLNLLGNAVKFTDEGAVTLHVECDRESGLMRFRVADTGIGMSPEQRDRVADFGAFSQADSSATRRFGGTGLGLRLSNAFAQLLGGSVEIESEQGVGSMFTATIDPGNLAGEGFFEPDRVPTLQEMRAKERLARRSPALPGGAEREGAGSHPLDGLRILLAEDGADNQRLITYLLEQAGAEVVLAENGRVALERMAWSAAGDGRPIDLVLMDMQMPELDGYTATSRLRAAGQRVPIVALTAHAMKGDRQRCLDAGCDAYLSKPIEKNRLLRLCARMAARNNPSDQRTAA